MSGPNNNSPIFLASNMYSQMMKWQIEFGKINCSTLIANCSNYNKAMVKT